MPTRRKNAEKIKISSRSKYGRKQLAGTARYMVQIYSSGRYYRFFERSMSDAKQQVVWWGQDASLPFQYSIFRVVEAGEYY